MKTYIFIFSIILSAAAVLAGCTSELTEDNRQQNVTTLRPGERLVNLSLTGLAGSGAVDTRAANESNTRAENESLTLAGECDIDALLIACFVNKATGSTVTNLDDYTLERLYQYRKQGTANDFLLLSDAEGYHAGIGVPQGDDCKRAFLLFANPGEETPDEASMGTYAAAGALAVKLAGADAVPSPTDLKISCPLPMGGIASHREISSEGILTDNPVFTQADLDRGLSARMIRRVSRIDVLNPDITGFKAESMKVKAATEMPYFKEATQAAINDYADIPLSKAEAAYGACYLLPPAAGTPVEVTLTGTLMGAPAQTLTASAVMKPNTRYLLRVRNNESNVRVEIEVADWDEGGEIKTDDISEKMNAACTVEVANPDGSPAVTIEGNRIHVAPAEALRGDFGIVTLTGAVGDTNPIGVIIPEDCDWLDLSEPTTTEGNSWQITLKAASVKETVTRKPTLNAIATAFLRPHTARVSFVYRAAAEGQLRFDTYEVTVDPDKLLSQLGDEYPASAVITGEGFWKSMVRIDNDAHTIHIPSVDGAMFMVTGYKAGDAGGADDAGSAEGRINRPTSVGPATYTSAYLTDDYDWIGQLLPRVSEGVTNKVFSVLGNTTGKQRMAQLEVGTYSTTLGKQMQAWTVVQSSDFDENLLADDATLKLRLMQQDELSMTGNVIKRNSFAPEHTMYSIYDAYINHLRKGDYVSAKAVAGRLRPTLIDSEAAETGDYIAFIYPSASAPIVVTADVPWINIRYKQEGMDAPYVVLDLDIYLPATVDEHDNPMPRRGTVTVHLKGGRTQTYIVEQEMFLKNHRTDIAEEMT